MISVILWNFGLFTQNTQKNDCAQQTSIDFMLVTEFILMMGKCWSYIIDWH